jgi:hypothetical protein
VKKPDLESIPNARKEWFLELGKRIEKKGRTSEIVLGKASEVSVALR